MIQDKSSILAAEPKLHTSILWEEGFSRWYKGSPLPIWKQVRLWGGTKMLALNASGIILWLRLLFKPYSLAHFHPPRNEISFPKDFPRVQAWLQGPPFLQDGSHRFDPWQSEQTPYSGRKMPNKGVTQRLGTLYKMERIYSSACSRRKSHVNLPSRSRKMW